MAVEKDNVDIESGKPIPSHWPPPKLSALIHQHYLLILHMWTKVPSTKSETNLLITMIKYLDSGEMDNALAMAEAIEETAIQSNIASNPSSEILETLCVNHMYNNSFCKELYHRENNRDETSGYETGGSRDGGPSASGTNGASRSLAACDGRAVDEKVPGKSVADEAAGTQSGNNDYISDVPGKEFRSFVDNPKNQRQNGSRERS